LLEVRRRRASNDKSAALLNPRFLGMGTFG
jgi:hypothetical protein